MTGSYSMDLGERVVAACDDGEDTREPIAERLFSGARFASHARRTVSSEGSSSEPRSNSPCSRGTVQSLSG